MDAPPRPTDDPSSPGPALPVVVGPALTKVRIATAVCAQTATNLRTDQYLMCPAARQLLGRSPLAGSVRSA